jgi:large subunit ribosomal protein L30
MTEKKVEHKPEEKAPDRPKQSESVGKDNHKDAKPGPVREEGHSKESQGTEPEKKVKSPKTAGRLIVIRVRGEEGVRHDIRRTLEMLHLHRKHFCSVVGPTAGNIGMLRKAKDYVTWGEVDQDTLNMLYEKRGAEYKGHQDGKTKYITAGGRKLKPFFRLHPPRGGFERKGIKKPFSTGGALGDRKKAIKDLLKRMI